MLKKGIKRAHFFKNIFKKQSRKGKYMRRNQYFGLLEFFIRSPSFHSFSIVRSKEIPRILPFLSFSEEFVFCFTSFSMNHQEIFVICSVRVFYYSHEMFSCWRYWRKYNTEGREYIIPLCKSFVATSTKFLPVVQSDIYCISHIESS